MVTKLFKENGCLILDVDKNMPLERIFGYEETTTYIEKKDGKIREQGWMTKHFKFIKLNENKTNHLYQVVKIGR